MSAMPKLEIKDWQTLLAKESYPQWSGDLEDDCTSNWAGLLLRAEWMDDTDGINIWWWAVTDLRSNIEIASSHQHKTLASNGKVARWLAEQSAVAFLTT